MQVARAPRGRPLVAAVAALLAVATVYFAVGYRDETLPWMTTTEGFDTKLPHVVDVRTGGAILFAIFAMIAVVSFARVARWSLEPAVGADYASVTRYAIILVGSCVTVVAAVAVADVRITDLLLSGAITGVLLTMAAQQALANLFAGVMLQFARPFTVGQRVQMRSGALAGTIEGTVVELSITYVQLATDAGLVFVPNSQALAAAVGAVPPPTPDLPLTPEHPEEDAPPRLGESEHAPATAGGADPDGQPARSEREIADPGSRSAR